MQRAPMFEVEDLADRNAILLSMFICTKGTPRLECSQGLSSDMLLRAYLSIVNTKHRVGKQYREALFS
jgi:hypothetical protein